MQRHDMQAVIQILAELTLTDGLHRLLIGGADDPHIHLARAGRAQWLHHRGLQETQQFGLQRGRHFANLIEEERAAIGSGGGAGLIGNGAGETAFQMPENLGFQQIMRDRATVQRDERPARARRLGMQRDGGQFFAGAAFAGDENGGDGPGD